MSSKHILSEETKLKNRERNRQHYKNFPEYYKQWKKDNVLSYLLAVARSRAKRRNIVFSLTKEDLSLPKFCPVLGIELATNFDTGAGGKNNSYSLDRIDPNLGYIKGNVQIISHQANSMKFTATKEELLKFAKWVIDSYGN